MIPAYQMTDQILYGILDYKYNFEAAQNSIQLVVLCKEIL
jgi:hypothetical protein